MHDWGRERGRKEGREGGREGDGEGEGGKTRQMRLHSNFKGQLRANAHPFYFRVVHRLCAHKLLINLTDSAS